MKTEKVRHSLLSPEERRRKGERSKLLPHSAQYHSHLHIIHDAGTLSVLSALLSGRRRQQRIQRQDEDEIVNESEGREERLERRGERTDSHVFKSRTHSKSGRR